MRNENNGKCELKREQELCIKSDQREKGKQQRCGAKEEESSSTASCVRNNVIQWKLCKVVFNAENNRINASHKVKRRTFLRGS